LLGRHQAVNAAVVLGIIEALAETGCAVSQEAVHAGVREASWPGRLEIVSKDPLVILDCAHNRSSARNLVESIVHIFPHKNVTLILGVSEDKDRAGICGELSRIAGRVIATKADHPRAHEFSREELNVLFTNKPSTCLSSVKEALASVADSTDIVLVTGSVFLVSEARRYLLSKKGARSKGQGSRFSPCSLPHAP
jgi:dihydrofolate synthase/folylpolyglutamate synthase